MLKKEEIEILTNLVGKFNPDQIDIVNKNIEYFLHPQLSLFTPVYRYCDYAVSPDHCHPGYCFIYSVSSSGALLVNGKKKNMPGNSAAYLCAISPGVLHQEIVEEGFNYYVALFISKEYFESVYNQYRPPKDLLFSGDFFEVDEALLLQLKMLMNEQHALQSGKGDMIDALIKCITHQVVRATLKTYNNIGSVYHIDKVDRVITFMYTHIDEKISVETLASEVNLSVSQFNKIFKSSTNKTPIEYLSAIRVDKAKHLLKVSDKNLTEIAFACGFTSSSYFSHSFIESVGLTPSEYRKRFSST